MGNKPYIGSKQHWEDCINKEQKPQDERGQPVLFRCHSAGLLLSEPKKTKSVYFINGVELTTAKANKLIDAYIDNHDFAGIKGLELRTVATDNELSETARTLTESMWLQNTYSYREIISTEAMRKGLTLEQDSMALAQQVLGGGFRSKNRETFSNEYLIGVPDVLTDIYVDDHKTCYSLRTFFEAEPSKQNITQLQCYMDLTGKRKARCIFTLVSNTEEAIIKECDRIAWQYGRDYENLDYIAHCEQIKINNSLINDIPAEQRVKVFEFGYDEGVIEKLYEQIGKAREYYNKLKL